MAIIGIFVMATTFAIIQPEAVVVVPTQTHRQEVVTINATFGLAPETLGNRACYMLPVSSPRGEVAIGLHEDTGNRQKIPRWRGTRNLASGVFGLIAQLVRAADS